MLRSSLKYEYGKLWYGTLAPEDETIFTLVATLMEGCEETLRTSWPLVHGELILQLMIFAPHLLYLYAPLIHVYNVVSAVFKVRCADRIFTPKPPLRRPCVDLMHFRNMRNQPCFEAIPTETLEQLNTGLT